MIGKGSWIKSVFALSAMLALSLGYVQAQAITPGQIVKWLDPDGNLTDSVISESANGNIGIGTASPSQKLDVAGTIRTDDLITKAPWVDVRAFGAKGDYNLETGNGTDDTAAIQAAIDAAPPGGTVVLPVGTYKVERSLIINKPLTLRGSGVYVYSGSYMYFGDDFGPNRGWRAARNVSGSIIISTVATQPRVGRFRWSAHSRWQGLFLGQ